MSRLEELIAELCPNGVEYKELGDVTELIKNGFTYEVDKTTTKKYKVSRIETISGGVINMEKVATVDTADERYRLTDGDILFSHINSLPYLGNIAFYEEKYGELYHGMNLLCFRFIRNIVLPKFAFYIFRTSFFRKYIDKYAKHSCNQYSLSISTIKKWKIPVPPLPVQEEIVRILDKFTELTAELATELAKRKQQYQYYRNTLVDFKEGFDRPSPINGLIAELCPNGVEYQPLKNVCEVRSGWGFPNSEQGLTEGELPFYKVSDMNNFGNGTVMTLANNYISKATAKKLGCSPAPSGTIIFPKIGAAIGTNKKRVLSTISCYDNNVVGLIPNNLIRSKFLFYIMDSINLMQFADYSGAMPSIRKTTLEKYRIPVPPLPIQKEIVRILDRFDALCNDLASGLPAEIEARKKQHEYYRDKLLTFKEAV